MRTQSVKLTFVAGHVGRPVDGRPRKGLATTWPGLCLGLFDNELASCGSLMKQRFDRVGKYLE